MYHLCTFLEAFYVGVYRALADMYGDEFYKVGNRRVGTYIHTPTTTYQPLQTYIYGLSFGKLYQHSL